MADRSCREVQSALVEALLARRAPEDADRAHADGCAACGAHADELASLRAALDAGPDPTLRPELASSLRARALRELSLLRPIERAPGATDRLPPGYHRELARLLAFAALPLPLIAAWYALLYSLGGELLEAWLPPIAVYALGAAFALGTASWLALIFGAIPFVAHRRAQRRSEVSA